MLTRCPHCSKAIKILPEHLDEVVYCPACRTSLVVKSPIVQPPPVIAAAPNIARRAFLVIRKILAWMNSGVSRVQNGFAQVRRASAERRRRAAEQIRKEAEQRQLVAAQREAERARKHRQWLTTLHREMASVPDDGAAMKAVHAFDKLTAMIGSLCQLGPGGFNEGEFNSTICTMWTNLQHPSLATVPTLHDHLASILRGFTDGWNKIKASWQSGGRQAPPLIIATGRNTSAAIGAQSVPM